MQSTAFVPSGINHECINVNGICYREIQSKDGKMPFLAVDYLSFQQEV
ncbi:hypothetical protein NIES2098_50530 [Calothrix sp. NIES-2098]|nr:hypothetical protein NIES2098_50530 [Calothrix sp. NIES-2098]